MKNKVARFLLGAGIDWLACCAIKRLKLEQAAAHVEYLGILQLL